ncbi:MAG: cadmium-translocating P-type ATPase [Bacteroidetes bacterium]|nr:cadmium-translocating P-type ATPase [Bacteroidota bacterium]MBS1632094.1 cadmium-translocating P-type ATPase [Bacteroidota bacterium]
MEKVQWKVEGMDCSNCALTIRKYLEKEGMKNVKVNFANGDVLFDTSEDFTKEEIAKGIHGLGYTVVNMQTALSEKKQFLATHLQRFLFCLPFTLILMLHMIPGIHFEWLMNPWINLALCIPVYFTGMKYFGKSAWKSIRNGIPNMNVLITLGSTAAFVYSLAASLMGLGEAYLFYETAATIITLIFLGNYLEQASIGSTQRALKKLVRSQKVMANVIAFDDQHAEHIFPVENTELRAGDLLLIKSGEQVPADCKILWGNASVNEAILTGESLPVLKQIKDQLIGGSILNDGTVKAQVTAAGDDTILSGIINLVKQAQGEKPPVQQMADKISAVFVPVVLIIAAITLAANWIILGSFTPAIMRAIAVLVIACPCAMGLATPAAIAVGLGRGTRKGILFRNATSLELFKNIQQAVFDKTGTLTTGKLRVAAFHFENSTEDEFKKIVFSLEKYSAHPIAKSIVNEWKRKDEIRWKKIEEIKGLGIKAEDKEGNIYIAGSFKIAESLTDNDIHNVYIKKNESLLGWIDLKDELRPEAKTVISYLHSKGIKTILLTGDRYQRSKELANELGIDEVIAEQSPLQKLEIVSNLTSHAPTIMVGDGINDAPALAKATIGISISDASQLAMQTAQVVLMNHGLATLPLALGLGKHTFITIKQNLFWAFFYNIVAIPVAALGFLTPSFSALAMGFSDVILAINSARLFTKKVE